MSSVMNLNETSLIKALSIINKGKKSCHPEPVPDSPHLKLGIQSKSDCESGTTRRISRFLIPAIDQR